MTIAPVVGTIETMAVPDRAFALFTQHMSDWWPGKTIGAKAHVAIVIEPYAEGRWFERAGDGEETLWGKVLVWEPPGRLVLGWQLDGRFVYDPDMLTEVEISFSSRREGGTTVRLEHRDLERYGADALRIAEQIGGGWPGKLSGFGRFGDQDGRAS